MADDDPRFANIKTDPRFRRLKRKERKVVIDSRFKRMFTDDKFKVKYSVDSRGRPVQLSSNDHLKKYYDLPSDEESDDNEENQIEKDVERNEVDEENRCENDAEEDEKNDENKMSENDEENEEQEDSSDSGDESDASYDPARGIGVADSSSDTDVSEEMPEEEEHPWAELDNEAPASAESTHRLAVCNMDWDNIRASDIFILLNSFTPSGGSIKSVTIYPSDYGLERMKHEEQHGPTELTQETEEEKKKDDVCLDDAEGDDEVSLAAREKLRQYQLNRLKYYYAIVECNSVNTASHIYDELDGKEFESTATRIDLRFVPNDMEFDHEPKETLNSAPPIYKPKKFITTALQQAKVRCTWDETDPERQRMLRKNYKKEEIDDLDKDLKAYLASDSDDEGTTNMITGSSSHKSTDFFPISEKNESDDELQNETGKKELSSQPSKKPAKKKQKRNEEVEEDSLKADQLELLLDDDDDGRQHFHLKDLIEPARKGKKKRKKMKEQKQSNDTFEINVDDSRFRDIYTNPIFNIDPTSKDFKETAGMRTLINEKLKRKSNLPIVQKQMTKLKSSKWIVN